MKGLVCRITLLAAGLVVLACQGGSSDSSQPKLAVRPREIPQPAPTPPAPPSTPKADRKPLSIRGLYVTKDLHDIIATRPDGSNLTIHRDRNRNFSLASAGCLSDCSKDLNWALIEWIDSDMIEGSLGGSISTSIGLLAVRHGRLLNATDLGFDRAFFLAIRVVDGREVLVVDVYENGRYQERNFPLEELDDLIERNVKRPLGKPKR